MADPPSDLPKDVRPHFSEAARENKLRLATKPESKSESDFSCDYEDLDTGECVAPSEDDQYSEIGGGRRNG